MNVVSAIPQGQVQTQAQTQAQAQALGLQCVSGIVTLFRFIVPPQPGSVIGQIATLDGRRIPLIQTGTSITPISSVDGQFATLCGNSAFRNGQFVLDVVLVIPSAPTPSGVPFDNRFLLLLLLLLLLNQPSISPFLRSNLTNITSLLSSGQQVDLNSLISTLRTQLQG